MECKNKGTAAQSCCRLHNKEYGGDVPSGGYRGACVCHAVCNNPWAAMTSAIWTAFVAAPLRRLSDTIHSESP